MAFIGSKISLISNLLVRYEGTLYTIDPRESTIALQNVRMMGTEDRASDKEIKATSTIYEYMIFKGENIKKLDLIEDGNKWEDPAISRAKELPSAELQAQEYYQQHQRNWSGQNSRGGYYEGGGRMQGWGRRGRSGGYIRRYNRGGYNGNNRSRGGGGLSNSARTGGPQNNRGPGKPGNRRRSGNNSNRNADKKNEKKDCPGTGKFLERQSKDNDEDALEIPDKEFDFQGNLARFDMSSMKEALNDDTKAEAGDVKPLDAEEENPADEEDKENGNEKEVEQEANKEEKPAYQKESFFDTLSTDRETLKRPTGSEMRELDAETFGKIGSTYRCKTRWFRRWRGNFRGRGAFRGGYNQRNAN